MTIIKVCSFQNNSTKKYRLLCLESRNDAWCLWETSYDLDYDPDPRTDKLACTIHQFGRPATYADYEQKRDHIVANGCTIVRQL